MSRRTRRVLPVLISAVLALGLTACGDEGGGGGSDSGDPLSQVTITGDHGKAPKVSWDGTFEADEITSETLIEGEGEEVSSGDRVQAHIWIGNAIPKEEVFSTFEQGPETLTADEEQLSEVFLEGLEGHTIGSRVAVAASATDAFGEQGNPQLQIGNKDSILVIIDLMEMYEEPKPVDAPKAQQPKVVEEKGTPVALDFAGLEEPQADGELLRTVVKEGDGKTLEPESTITANYLGMVHGAKKPFDESYSKQPAEFSLQQVVPGWTYGLSGLKVGSRVLLTIPPELGYGAQEQAGIPADSTLYFVVDIISAK